jgi:hypothetical protein
LAVPVFSSQFIVYTDAAPNTSYEVPDGFVAVIRDFTLFTSIGATGAQLSIQNSATASSCVVAWLAAAGLEDYHQWTGRVVVPSGGFITLDVVSAGEGANSYVGGYLLRS